MITSKRKTIWVIVVLLLVPFFTLFFIEEIRSGFVDWLQGWFNYFRYYPPRLTVDGSRLVLILIILIVEYVLARFIFMHFTRRVGEICPNCRSPLRISHRSFWDKLISRVLLHHVHRYKCTNPECRWSGLQNSSLTGARKRGPRRPGKEPEVRPEDNTSDWRH
jgi:hypothetical protein